MPSETQAGQSSGAGLAGTAAAMVGLLLAGLGCFLFLSVLSADVKLDPETSAKNCWTGLAGAWLAFGGVYTLGRIPALLLSLLVASWGGHIAAARRFLATWPQVFGGAVMIAASALGYGAAGERYDMDAGGLLAVYASPPALLYFGRWGLVLASAGAFILGALLAFGMAAVEVMRHFAFGLRDFCLGFLSLGPYLGVIAGRLFRPDSPAMAGVSADSPPAADTAAIASAPLAKSVQPPTGAWQPRQPFVSSYLSGTDADGSATVYSEVWPEPIPPRPGFERSTPDAAVAGAMPTTVPEAVEAEPDPVGAPVSTLAARIGPPYSVSAPSRPSAPAPEPTPMPTRPAMPSPEPRREEPRPPEIGEAAASGDELAAYHLPPLELLDPQGPPVMEDQAQSEARSRILERTLGEFRIEGKVVHIERGPRVTMFEISLAPGIRLNKVTSLADNLAMQLQAESVRIVAPIPGKNTIGIEIPNTIKELVTLREITGAVNREKRRQALPVCLGKDVSGQALVADLTRMPHLLIAGATGSGKSVCINSIILSILACCRPDEAQLIMVDPKVVELSRFKDIPHLMSPVITDMKRAVAVLEWICQKMDERYEQMSQVSVNNIAKFNALGIEGIRDRLDAFASLEEIEAFPKRLPYMVVIIDELADLMMVAGKEVEQHITRLAAKSRAVGIHLILATQRPSVDVITGLIKANMPCRIAFQVASRVDSRTILDQNGAETLLGQGDMLYLPPGVGKLTRAQGVFVSDDELFRMVDFVKTEAGPRYHPDLLGPVIGSGTGAVDVSSFDELFLPSGEAIIESQRGSVSLLQRKFGIGYGRASRIIDQLSSVGLLGPFRDGKAREILLTLEEFKIKFGGAASGDEAEPGLAGLRDDEREPEDSWDRE